MLALSASVMPVKREMLPGPPFAKPSVFTPWSRKKSVARSERS